jgi:hypothetical protein
MPVLQTIPHDGLEGAQRRLAVVAIALALIMAVLDGAIANVAARSPMSRCPPSRRICAPRRKPRSRSSTPISLQ